jgi:cell division septation protein DedD
VLTALDTLATAADPGGYLLRLVLIGQPLLETRLTAPATAALDRRLASRIRLQPLERDELLPFILHRDHMDNPGGSPPHLTSDALDRLFEESEGIPSRVQLLIKNAAHAGVTATRAPHTRSRTTLKVIALIAATVAVATTAGWWWILRPAAARRATGTTVVPKQTTAPVFPAVAPVATPLGVSDTSGATSARPSEQAPGGPSPGANERPAASSDELSTVGTIGRPTEPASANGVQSRGTVGDSGAPSPLFSITVAAFRTKERAAEIAEEVRDLGLRVHTQVDVTGRWIQVIVGPYSTIQEGTGAQRLLASAGYPETLLTIPVVQRPPAR